MKALSLSGPWAHYQKQLSDSAERVSRLEGEVSSWKQLAEDARAQLASTRAELAVAQRQSLAVQEENQRARGMISQLEGEAVRGRKEQELHAQELQAQLSVLRSELEHLNSDNALLKQELAKNTQV